MFRLHSTRLMTDYAICLQWESPPEFWKLRGAYADY